MTSVFHIPNARRRQLASRSSGALRVALFWTEADGSIDVEICHRESGVRLAFSVPGNRALDAFYRPFAYMIR